MLRERASVLRYMFIACLFFLPPHQALQLYRIRSLHPSGYLLTTEVARTEIKETRSSSNHSTLSHHDRLGYFLQIIHIHQHMHTIYIKS